MELHDCAFPLLEVVSTTSDLAEGFRDVNWALLVGSVPRKAGMERKELLGINGKIFVEQGRAIAKHAASDIRVLVVGNPCNTNCLIAMNNAREVPSDRWFAMTRLDENRAKTQLALKSGSHWTEVTNVAIWGNHSSTLFPDFFNARIGGSRRTRSSQIGSGSRQLSSRRSSCAERRLSRREAFLPRNRRHTAQSNPLSRSRKRLLRRIGTAWLCVQTAVMILKKA